MSIMSNEKFINKIVRENPLIAFSLYTHLQVEIVRDLGHQILEILDTAFDSNAADGKGVNRAYGSFWLWVLGSYEITRTFCQAESCFSGTLVAELKGFKKKVAILRMPFAKQEYPRKKEPIKTEASSAGRGYEIGGRSVSKC